MRGCLFTLALGAAALALLVVVGLPAVGAALVTAGLTAAGLQSDDTRVEVSSDPPTELIGLHADQVVVRANDASFRGMTIDRLYLALADVALLDRTAGVVDGRLDGVVVADVGGGPLALASIRVRGGRDTVIASTTIARADVEQLLADAVEAAHGERPSAVRIGAPDRVVATIASTEVAGRFVVRSDGSLGIAFGSGATLVAVVPVLRADGGLPLRITSAEVTADGLLLTGELTFGFLG